MSTRRQFLLGWAALSSFILASVCHAEGVRRWDFHRAGDREGWTVPPEERGVVMGGAMWLMFAPREKDPSKLATAPVQIWGGGKREVELLVSPADLNIPAAEATQVRMRVVNLSSLSDYFLRWRTKEQGWGQQKLEEIVGLMGDPATPQARRCTLKADVKPWQELTCYIDQRWKGTIEQIAFLGPQNWLRGNLWIDWIEIGKGEPEPTRVRPDVASERVVPTITIPGISQQGFADAFKVLDECLIVDLPVYGFNYPVMGPGGIYTKGGWWQMDSSVTATGAKWANPAFAEDVLRGFSDLQDANPDGRVDYNGQYGLRGQAGDVSMLPSYFEVAYAIARRTSDEQLRRRIYKSIARYVDWWRSPTKSDTRTGLVSGTFEETFPHMLKKTYAIHELGTYAPVDLNVAVAVGAARTAELAEVLGEPDQAARYRAAFEALAKSINTHLWDENAGAYYDYDLRAGQRRPGISVSTFDPLRLGIAPEARQRRLLKRLLDPRQFNWGHRFLTSWSKADLEYVEENGSNSILAWYGNIWALRNSVVTAGLEESGRPDLAAELNWSTIKTFHSNYFEYVSPTTGQGYGAQRYGMSASLYVAAIVEHLFGVDYDRIAKRIAITPHVPKALYRQELALENLVLPTRDRPRLSVYIKQTGPKTARIRTRISGSLPEGALEFLLPGTTKKISLPVQAEWSGTIQ